MAFDAAGLTELLEGSLGIVLGPPLGGGSRVAVDTETGVLEVELGVQFGGKFGYALEEIEKIDLPVEQFVAQLIASLIVELSQELSERAEALQRITPELLFASIAELYSAQEVVEAEIIEEEDVD